MLPKLIAQVRNANLPSMKERTEYLFNLIKANPEANAEFIDKLILAACSNIIRQHFSDCSAHIFNKGEAQPVQEARLQEIKNVARAEELKTASRQMKMRFMNMPVCGGNILLRDATRIDIAAHLDYLENKQLKPIKERIKFFEIIMSKLRDDLPVIKCVNESDLERFHAIATHEPPAIAAE